MRYLAIKANGRGDVQARLQKFLRPAVDGRLWSALLPGSFTAGERSVVPIAKEDVGCRTGLDPAVV
jgi:hypothetical protein